MADYKYKELEYAKKIYENGFLSEQHRPTELRLVATYMRRILDYKPKKLREKLYQWCESNIAGFQRELYYKEINSAITKACKKGSTLINIQHIDFYQYEMDYINSLHIFEDMDNKKEYQYSYECKKLLFTLLFQMKINKQIMEIKCTDRDYQYEGKYFKGGQKKYNELKKLAKLPEKVKLHEELINTLWINGLVSPMFNGLIQLNFMEELNATGNHDAALQIKDFDSVGWYFDYYNHDKKIIFCKGCGRILRKKTNRQEYCSDDCFLLYRRNYKTKKQRAYRSGNECRQLENDGSP